MPGKIKYVSVDEMIAIEKEADASGLTYAKMMENAGAIALLLEAVPMEVARLVTEATDLPVIGCVSGPHCDGQVVVLHDMLGYGGGHPPRSVKQYAKLYDQLVGAFGTYAKEVAEATYPTTDHGTAMDPAAIAELHKALETRAS